jgi:hypothetical protein
VRGERGGGEEEEEEEEDEEGQEDLYDFSSKFRWKETTRKT